ncbi:hypothetical protein AB6D11_00085 [Vibrio splendidus]
MTLDEMAPLLVDSIPCGEGGMFVVFNVNGLLAHCRNSPLHENSTYPILLVVRDGDYVTHLRPEDTPAMPRSRQIDESLSNSEFQSRLHKIAPNCYPAITCRQCKRSSSVVSGFRSPCCQAPWERMSRDEIESIKRRLTSKLRLLSTAKKLDW